jgi:hypothetical protein
MKKLFVLFSALFVFAATSPVMAQDANKEEDNSVSFKGYAYNEMRDVAKGKKIEKGTVKLLDEKGEEVIEEKAFTDVEPFILQIEPEVQYTLEIFDADGKLLKSGPFGISAGYYEKNEELEKGRWVPFVEGRREYGLAVFTSTPKLPPTKYTESSTSGRQTVGNMKLPDLMSSLTELRAFSW